jgi:hypothetical protein
VRSKNETQIIDIDEDIVPIDPAEPERALLVAILLNAYSDLNLNGRESEIAKDFFKNTDEDYIFSFRCICNHLNVDYKDILNKVSSI